jgi:hypothetical protein
VNVGTVSLTLVASKATFDRVRGAMTLNARTGETHITASGGQIDLEANQQPVTIDAAAGPVRVSGTAGDISVDRPRADVRVDVRRANVTLTVDAPAPVTVLTADGRIRLYLAENLPVTIDAVTSVGHIDGHAFDLSAEASGDDVHLLHAFGDRARIVLRNQRGDIEIAPRK